MEISAIICEYNPFHNGHKYLVENARKKGASHIIAIMSGNFVQRGETALFDKHERAKIACENGCDLVIELPLPFCCSSAENFSKGAISILNSTKIVNSLIFGSEIGDIEQLKECANASINLKDNEVVKVFLSQGLSYPNAVSKAISSIYGEELSEVFSSPNNTLGIEYIKALILSDSKIKPKTIFRKNAPHDSDVSKENFASASLLRKKIFAGESVEDLVPKESYFILENAINKKNISDFSKYSSIIKYKILSERKSLLDIADMDFELLERLYKGCESYDTIEEIITFTKSKKYTHARIRRVVLNILLGIKKSDLEIMPSFARILAFNEKGRELIPLIRKNFPIDTSLAKLSRVSATSKNQADFDKTATDIYSMSLLSQSKKNEFSTFVSIL